MKGRPILGIVAGFLFGLFGGLTLFLFGTIPLHSDLLWILPLVGIVLGLVLAAWAPVGGDSSQEAETPEASMPATDDEPESTGAAAADVASRETTVDVEVFPEDEGSQSE